MTEQFKEDSGHIHKPFLRPVISSWIMGYSLCSVGLKEMGPVCDSRDSSMGLSVETFALGVSAAWKVPGCVMVIPTRCRWEYKFTLHFWKGAWQNVSIHLKMCIAFGQAASLMRSSHTYFLQTQTFTWPHHLPVVLCSENTTWQPNGSKISPFQIPSLGEHQHSLS